MSNGHESTLVYILAASHSGSTLTAMLLNAHPEICTAGELKADRIYVADDYACSCRQPIAACSFWANVSSGMESRGIEYDVTNARTGLRSITGKYIQRLLRPLHRGPLLESVRDLGLSLSPSWRSKFNEWCRRNKALVESVAAESGARFVADSSKVAVRLKYLRRVPGLRVKVVRLIRDGRGVALTYLDPANFADASDPNLRGGGTGQAPDYGMDMTQSAHQWLRANEEAEEVLKTIPEEDFIQISYEALCTRTDETMARIHTFLGIREDSSHHAFRNAPHHIVGNGMRLDDHQEIRLDDRWRDTLTKEQLAEFDRVAGSLNRQYGYE